MSEAVPRDKVWRILDVILAIAITSGMGVIGYQQQVLMHHTEEIATIQASRFTSADGLEVWREIAELRREVAVIPREVPPSWFLQRVDKLEQQIDANNKMLLSIDKELHKHEVNN